MHGTNPLVPAGFVRFAVRDAEVVCAAHVADAARAALASGTLYQYAQRHPAAHPLAGRGIAYAVPLPGNTDRVVIRHNRHGGLLAPLTGDLFVPPTRAPYELEVAERLTARGVPTPRVLGYVIYHAGPWRRADVMTREVPTSCDLSATLVNGSSFERARALAATARLIRALAQAGARHHDLNVKNVLLHTPTNAGLEALALDVDRVTFEGGTDTLERNLARLLRSATKWQRERGAQVTDAELDAFAALVRGCADIAANTLS